MLALLLAAGAALAHPVARPAQPARSIDQRVALLEARQLLESQALWGLQAAMPGDALKALSDLDLHLARDQEQEERVKLLQGQVQLLESRLAEEREPSLQHVAAGRRARRPLRRKLLHVGKRLGAQLLAGGRRGHHACGRQDRQRGDHGPAQCRGVGHQCSLRTR